MVVPGDRGDFGSGVWPAPSALRPHQPWPMDEEKGLPSDQWEELNGTRPTGSNHQLWSHRADQMAPV